MSSFTFIHAADLHLGSPFQSLAVKDAAIAARFAQATRGAFTKLVNQAIDRQVDFLVIAGDVYDGEWKDNSVGLFFNREVARLAKANIQVVFLRGNHDAESVVTKSVPLPDSVQQFPTNKAATIRFDHLDVALHGQGFAERAAQENLALAYPAPIAGLFNIGVLHTSLTGRPPHDVYAPCSAEDLRNRGYDYWALGHVHEFEIVSEDPHIVFPGNLQGRSIRETGAKGAVLVSVEDGRVQGIEPVVLDEARWSHLVVDISDHEEPGTIAHAVAAAFEAEAEAAGERLLAMRIELTGTCRFRRKLVANRVMLADEIEAACHHHHPDAWLEKLVVSATAPTDEAIPAIDRSIDIEAMLAEVLGDEERRQEVDDIVRQIAAKLPGGIGSGETPLGTTDDLLAEAREVLLARVEIEA
ncbi:Putative exonuclease [Fulvimarina pelagi HTCC2506]|uniref:Putative exonuclease n=2 Tax=Fulvimarina pelagi TaxID=217511 RepID=Q0FZV9_9HYPH|nr:DNA repair exonuclease [Fulvimarina pelagi]EAU40482.1 Putative exonuclease [Fulvimarina pelagi HTCC2506]BAT31508.1 putative exonuclease [Fulvimarina pelagi]